jgi:hypothetical protein
VPFPRRLGALRRVAIRAVRTGLLTSDRVTLPLLVTLTLAVGVLSTVVGPAWMPPSSVVLNLLAGGLFLRTRSLWVLDAAVIVALLFAASRLGLDAIRPGLFIVVVLTAIFAHVFADTRETLGVQGLRGESMLADLRDRLRALGELPALPPGWQADVAVHAAGGSSFGGDFLVSTLDVERGELEVVLVDVSGKGVDAGTRALLLSGAFGGLIGAIPPEDFLPAANAYLLRQQWEEGFATAVHVVVDLGTGRYVVESAGHPPAAHFEAGSGQWRLTGIDGTALGLLPKAEYATTHGVLGHGDALLLFTDGLIEVPGQDLATGLDKLVGEAERLVPRGFCGGAGRLVHAVSPQASDDRALVLLWRE